MRKVIFTAFSRSDNCFNLDWPIRYGTTIGMIIGRMLRLRLALIATRKSDNTRGTCEKMVSLATLFSFVMGNMMKHIEYV